MYSFGEFARFAGRKAHRLVPDSAPVSERRIAEPDSGGARFSRRKLLLGSLAAGTVLAGAAGGYWYLRDRVRLGIIGCGIRGRALANKLRLTALYPISGEVVAICDVNRPRAELLRQDECRSAVVYDDYRRVLERDDIEGVIIASPDHWHVPMALDAISAGKAIYLEKPISRTVDEGIRLVEAARSSSVTIQVGMQQRSDWGFRTACELVRAGRLGRIKQVKITLMEKGLDGGPFAPQAVPAGLNWPLWLGPAQPNEYCPERYDNWRYWWDYSGGEMTNWGVHHLDIAQWALGFENSGPVRIKGEAQLPSIPNGYETPRKFRVELEFPDGTPVEVVTSETASNGVSFEGTTGTLFVNRDGYRGTPYDNLAERPLAGNARLYRKEPSGRAIVWWHLVDFMECLRSGATPVSDLESAHRSATTCHVANIALRVGRELQWDPQQERFLDDAEANALLRADDYPLPPIS